ncbi:hypothetical protein CDEST_01266 [Colletotrichum destructivum]|uniref:Uncharacterized protein n=1 Tax=Colletotrichum destructivum TaxID=34406 RepID=A0AAX4HYU8_9PEZI|nr:hypothetical protein CDEST_01266 [Colletotrichum destructivum]
MSGHNPRTYARGPLTGLTLGKKNMKEMKRDLQKLMALIPNIKTGAADRAADRGFNRDDASDVTGNDTLAGYMEVLLALDQCSAKSRRLSEAVAEKNEAMKRAMESGDAIFENCAATLRDETFERALRLAIEAWADNPTGEEYSKGDVKLDPIVRLASKLQLRLGGLPPDVDIPSAPTLVSADRDRKSDAAENSRLRKAIEGGEVVLARARGALAEKERQMAELEKSSGEEKSQLNRQLREERANSVEKDREIDALRQELKTLQDVQAALDEEADNAEMIPDSQGQSPLSSQTKDRGDDDRRDPVMVKKYDDVCEQLLHSRAAEAQSSTINVRLEREGQELRNALETAVAQLKNEQADHEATKDNLQTTTNNRSEILERTHKERVSMGQELADARAMLNRLSELAQSRRFRVLKLETEMAYRANEARRFEKQSSESADKLASVQRELQAEQSARSDFEERCQRRSLENAALADDVARANAIAQEQQALLDEASAKAQRLEEELTEAQWDLKRARAACKETGADLARERQGHIDARQARDAAEGECKVVSGKLDATKKELATAQDKLAAVWGDLNAAQGKIRSAQKEADSLKRQVADHESAARRTDDQLTQLRSEAVAAAQVYDRWDEFWSQNGDRGHWSPLFEAIRAREPEATQRSYEPWQVCASWGDDDDDAAAAPEQELPDLSLAGVTVSLMHLLEQRDFRADHFGVLMRRLARCLSECVNMSPDAMRLLVKRCIARIPTEPMETRRVLDTQVAAVADVLAERWIALEDLAKPPDCVLHNMAALAAIGQPGASWAGEVKTLRVERGSEALLLIKHPDWESVIVWRTGTKTFWFAHRSCVKRLSGVRIELRAPMGQESIFLRLADRNTLRFWHFCCWLL